MTRFIQVGLEHRDRIETELIRHGGLCCEYSFQNLFNWGQIYDARWAELDGTMYLYYGLENSLLMPVPNIPPEELARVPDTFGLSKDDFTVCHATEGYIAAHPDVHEHFVVEDDDQFFDYVHSIDRLAELKGSKLAKKKNLISQFTRNNPSYECRPIVPDIYEECFRLAEKWCTIRTCEHIGITHEKSAIRRAFDHFEVIGLEGLAIFASGGLCAFSVFSMQNAETFIEHFEKADTGVKGAAQIINWETAKHLRGKAKFLNREQDLGIEGLRKAKSSYDPDVLIGGKTLKLKVNTH